jgi:translation initiation factor 1 (eIF-1/SUI1)
MTEITDLQAKYANNGNSDPSTGKTIIQLQKDYIEKIKELVNEINIANKNIKSEASSHANIHIKSTCPNAGTIHTKINNLDDAKLEFDNSFSTTNDYSSYSKYDTIIDNNKEIQKLRNELDLKLKDLNHTPDSRFKNYEDNYNYELIMNITWSILATSIIYFVFVKLK